MRVNILCCLFFFFFLASSTFIHAYFSENSLFLLVKKQICLKFNSFFFVCFILFVFLFIFMHANGQRENKCMLIEII